MHAHVRGALRAWAGREAALLDAGCGTGGLMRRLADEKAWRWTGVDISPVAVALARERAPAAEVREAPLTALPLGDARFDAVVSTDVLYHLDDDAAAVREFVRVLRPGGVAVINVPAHPWLWSYHDVAVEGRRRYTRAGMRRLLVDAGFGVERLTHWNTLPLPLIVARRKLWPAPAAGSDVRLMPAPVEGVLRGAMTLERAWLRTGAAFPWGSSIFAVGRKGG
ncbi:class I SAM-dependent methyltransferase [Horticoccus luteus]|uniref:Class I SAM-dependent methyltransferase n=1 Tax=Horticoccus luteus TaxID=2862869 RepID=A0A8F9TT41_9BACT|nr:class I SAM-dependent methyltransferase [Horticoccus luteus]QYM77556.1 class I SAM-dependent methyltransferase [Horticoccus luteus]